MTPTKGMQKFLPMHQRYENSFTVKLTGVPLLGHLFHAGPLRGAQNLFPQSNRKRFSVNFMVEGWPRRALSPGPQSSSLLASSWKSIGPRHSYAMRGFLPAEADTRARQPRWSAGGQNPGRGGLFLGLPLSYGLRRGAILERPSMCSVVPNQNLFIRLPMSFKGEERSASPRHAP
jgi:hypothetical protein